MGSAPLLTPLLQVKPIARPHFDCVCILLHTHARHYHRSGKGGGGIRAGEGRKSNPTVRPGTSTVCCIQLRQPFEHRPAFLTLHFSCCRLHVIHENGTILAGANSETCPTGRKREGENFLFTYIDGCVSAVYPIYLQLSFCLSSHFDSMHAHTAISAAGSEKLAVTQRGVKHTSVDSGGVLHCTGFRPISPSLLHPHCGSIVIRRCDGEKRPS
mmetsp:Transcript_34425/g.89096  ORF Transcript_34425/g.89096 Transcript_34425/m.89096 type:complete len:213 (-) Transcript_34425:207-845(-)